MGDELVGSATREVVDGLMESEVPPCAVIAARIAASAAVLDMSQRLGEDSPVTAMAMSLGAAALLGPSAGTVLEGCVTCQARDACRAGRGAPLPEMVELGRLADVWGRLTGLPTCARMASLALATAMVGDILEAGLGDDRLRASAGGIANVMADMAEKCNVSRSQRIGEACATCQNLATCQGETQQKVRGERAARNN